MSDNKKEGRSSGNSETIIIKVMGQDNATVQFKLNKWTPLGKLMNIYCDRSGHPLSSLRFRYDGEPVYETDTPLSLKMEEGDTIEVYQAQIGGW